MLSYPLAEARELLAAKLAGAERALENVGEDVEFIREQATIMDVNLARVYNYDVKRCVLLDSLVRPFDGCRLTYDSCDPQPSARARAAGERPRRRRPKRAGPRRSRTSTDAMMPTTSFLEGLRVGSSSGKGQAKEKRLRAHT
jgi:hypothetical protein